MAEFMDSAESESKDLHHKRDSVIQRPSRGQLPLEHLPLRSNDPPFSAWGLWGDGDELGALNLLTPEIVKQSLNEVQLGLPISLNLAFDALSRPMNPARKPCHHRIIAKGRANDDELEINTQGSSHWDGLRHVPYQDSQLYYNGIRQEDISPTPQSDHPPNAKIGIQNAAKRGIVGRGILLDWYRYAQAGGIGVDAFSRQTIPLSDLLNIAEEQGVHFRRGDILLVRTGWTVQYNQLPESTKLTLPDGNRSFIGVEASREMMQWHWDKAFAAVATDTVAYEAMPFDRDGGKLCLHEVFLSGWGMMIGETWDLEALASECDRLGKWTFLLTSACLNVKGGVASPSNALAIL